MEDILSFLTEYWYVVLAALALIPTLHSLTRHKRAAKNITKMLENVYSDDTDPVIIFEDPRREVPRLNHQWYDDTEAMWKALGFRKVADYTPEKAWKTFKNNRCYVRTCLSRDGEAMVAFYHMRPKGILFPLLLMLSGQGRESYTTDIETELSDGSFVCTTTANPKLLMNQGEKIVRSCYQPETQPQTLLLMHQNSVRDYLESHPNAQPLRLLNLKDLLKSQERQHAIKAQHRRSVGYFSESDADRLATSHQMAEDGRAVAREMQKAQAKNAEMPGGRRQMD